MDARDVKRVAVIGAGTMGSGIAGVFARAGCEVVLTDRSRCLTDRGMELLRSAQEALEDAGHLEPAGSVAALQRIRIEDDLADACRDADIVIEAVTESLEPKQELFALCDRLCTPDCVLATNTSGLSISAIASATGRQDRVAGMHFWNPPHVIPLVEVVRGAGTSEATSRMLVELARRLGKTPVLVQRDVPGFIGNRLQFAVLREALHMMSEGIASAEDIDAAMTNGPGLRYALMGPLRIADLGGLDVFHSISGYLFRELCSAGEPSETLGKLAGEGRLGVKTGEGFYEYRGNAGAQIAAERDRALLAVLSVLHGIALRKGNTCELG